MKKRIVIILTVVFALAVLCSGTYLVLRYCFDYDILDRSGWQTGDDGSVRYLDYYGDPLVGWHEIDGVRYYLDPSRDGRRVTGWLELDQQRYYLDENGGLVHGWLSLDEGKYYLGENGTLTTGWQTWDGLTYYFADSGLLKTGWVEIDAVRYYFDGDGVMQTGWIDQPEGQYYLDEWGAMATGWLELQGIRYHLSESGVLNTGWTEIDGNRYYYNERGEQQYGWLDQPEGRYYLDESGVAVTGWIEQDGIRYYLQADGKMAVGKVEIDGETHFFTSAGKPVLLVNLWNPVPKGYKADLVELYGFKISAECKQPLLDMMDACRSAGFTCQLNSAYRGISFQQKLWDRRYNSYLDQGYSKSRAAELTSTIVLPPGTSEHHLGLAVDIVGNDDMYAWMAENCLQFGFILRYPDGKTDVTGIIYEPWHFRYVGLELAQELNQLGLTMEEYMDMLTERAAAK